MGHKRLAAAAAVTIFSAPAAMVLSAGPAAATAAPTVKLEKTNIGSIVVTGNGSVVYLFTRDPRNVDSCVKISGCPAVWPPLYVAGRPVGGPGVRASLLGTIRVGSRLQVTYAGRPLYGYAQNSNTFSTGYVGTAEFGGSWDAVSATGGAIR